MAEGSARILLVDYEHAVQKLLAYPLREFRSRVKAALRRSDMLGTGTPAGEPIVAGALEVDFDRRGVMVGNRGVRLTRRVRILAAPAADSGRVLTRWMLLERVWGDSEYRDPGTIDVQRRPRSGRADHPYPAGQRLDPYPGRNSDLRHGHAGGRDCRARGH